MKFSIKDFVSKNDQICRKLRILWQLRKKSLMENLIFCAVQAVTKRLKQNPMQVESSPNIIFCYFQPDN